MRVSSMRTGTCQSKCARKDYYRRRRSARMINNLKIGRQKRRKRRRKRRGRKSEELGEGKIAQGGNEWLATIGA
jgi:hypothetical protein